MNKRVAKEKSRSPSTGLVLLIVGGMVLLLGLLWAWGRGRETAVSPESNIPGQPVLQVDQSLIDYGDVKFGTPLSFRLTVTNKGDGTLRFQEEPYIEVVEGC